MPDPNQLELLDHSYGGEIIRQRASDGYVDATAMCKAASKNWADYVRLNGTQAFLTALSSDMGIPMSALVQSIRGGAVYGQGTWVHRERRGYITERQERALRAAVGSLERGM